MRANSILETIGNTPHIRLNRIFKDQVTDGQEVWLKLERANPGGSIKDRIALAMVEAAEQSGVLNSGSVIIEPTSGNTGIGLALVAAARGYKLTLVMPESMSLERRRYMVALGAELVLTPREKGMPGAIAKAAELVANTPNSWMPQQFENQANVTVHERQTAQEILVDFEDTIDLLITGVGTGGHITGVGRALKAKNSACKVLAVEPAKSPVLSGGQPGPHPIQGIGAGFIPTILDRSVLDGVVQVSEEEAFEYARRAARDEGIFLGISSGATLAAIGKKLVDFPEAKTILGFCYDTGERYLSIPGLFE